MKWLLIFREQYSENTPLYGHGDFPEQLAYIAAVIEADTRRQALASAKALFPGTRLAGGGLFSPRLIKSDDKAAALYTKGADWRLSRPAVHLHRASLAALDQ